MIRRRPHAITAIIEQAEYIGQDSLAVAERFLDATEATLRDREQGCATGLQECELGTKNAG